MLKEDKIHISCLAPFLPQPWEPSAITDFFFQKLEELSQQLLGACIITQGYGNILDKGVYSDSQFKDAVLPSVGALKQELEVAGRIKTEEVTA